MNTIKLGLGLLIALTTVSAKADPNLYVRAKTYYYSCEYFSNYQGEVEVTYSDVSLPWGSTVELIYGLEVRNGTGWGFDKFDWNNTKAIDMTAVSPYAWQATFRETLGSRSIGYSFSGIQFVLKITTPDGRESYERGSPSDFGFYNMRFNSTDPGKCIGATGYSSPERVPFEDMSPETVDRWY